MVASLASDAEAHVPKPNGTEVSDSKNRILRVLMRRLGSSKTFGENMIFMLNRARMFYDHALSSHTYVLQERTPEDLCMQLLILKILYVLFTTKGTSEYFYTNDLCVLVDVFLRELVDLDEDSESVWVLSLCLSFILTRPQLRHTYLRVLHPLLTKTQLRDMPYKRPQIVYALESLMGNARIRDVNPTTKRLVERCLGGEWCVQLRKAQPPEGDLHRRGTPTSDTGPLSPNQMGVSSVAASAQLQRSSSKTLKSSKSVEHLKGRSERQPWAPRSALDKIRRPSNASSHSLSGVANANVPHSANPPLPTPRRKGTIASEPGDANLSNRHPNSYTDREGEFHKPNYQLIPPVNLNPVAPSLMDGGPQILAPQRRSAPPPPPKRRKPPAIPAGRTNGGATITTIRTSTTSPLSKVTKAPSF